MPSFKNCIKFDLDIKENILTQCWIMNRRIHDLALFILSKIESEDKANKVLVLLDV